MSGFNISNFKSNGLVFGGARPTLFSVRLTKPLAFTLDNTSMSKFEFTCRGSQLPPATVGTIEIPYFGRNIKLAGDRTFPDWNVTVMNDEDFLVRSMFESWSNALNSLESNVRAAGTSEQYKADLIVSQYGKEGDTIRQYRIIGAFPSAIDPIDLNWDSQNQIEQFGVTFSYDYWLPEGTETANPYLGAAQASPAGQ